MATLMTQQMMLINDPIYDEKCKYFHSNSGCKYGQYCYYKHLKPCSSSPYQTLLQYHQSNNQLLHEILASLQVVIAKIYPNNPGPNALQQTVQLQEYKSNTPTPKLKPTPLEPILMPELKSDTPTPESTPTTAQPAIEPEPTSALQLQTQHLSPSTISNVKYDNNPVTKAVRMYRNLQQNPIRPPQALPNISFYRRLKEIWPNIQYPEQFEQLPQPQIIDAQRRAQMIQQIDIEYRELFDSMS